jgi:hypothetical protein
MSGFDRFEAGKIRKKRHTPGKIIAVLSVFLGISPRVARAELRRTPGSRGKGPRGAVSRGDCNWGLDVGTYSRP